MKTILSLYDYSGAMVEPWIENGFLGIIVDSQHPKGETREGNLIKWGGDILELEPKLKTLNNVVFVSSFPPCTDLAVSGARWFKRKAKENPRFQDNAMMLVHAAKRIGEWYNVPYFIENPVSVISTLWRKQDYYFHPYEYSGFCPDETYTKKTCLWANEKFIMPEPFFDKEIDPDNRIHTEPPGPNRKNNRSKTPLGFARAVFYANGAPE